MTIFHKIHLIGLECNYRYAHQHMHQLVSLSFNKTDSIEDVEVDTSKHNV